ncbi:MarR family winged helix-turn-helix transcriptional regulator [Azospirillum picis]|uniref:DNA-binding MarR family transcriptional regulator n=1 Tax=Azospirillum picis TaxID=488438 RepID=A0ABU0MQU0_9PROT|nr:MarR family transcriptional regulator [Azospirillum picis]MBP2302263.1 DNA-binding MarR family transcriptional regulator [Azospirillum picis]MDQ0535842.1 DNA-binding MarR family transcriptional regulator [Azospirillum picis]
MNDPSSRDAETASLLRQAVGTLSRRLRQAGKSQGDPQEGPVSLAGLSVLARLHRGGARTPSALAIEEHMQPQSLTRVLAALEEKGFISRSADPADRRQVLVRLTEDGTALLREEARRRDEWLRSALATLSPTERDLLRLAAGLMLDLDARTG